MRAIGELCLLMAFVCAGLAAFLGVSALVRPHRSMQRMTVLFGLTAVTAISAALGVLAYALYSRDFSFDYVARYSSRLLPRHYSLSALWVGQAGSLLLWCWLTGLMAVLHRCWSRSTPSSSRDAVFGLLMAFVTFLVTVMLFAADPMRASVVVPREGQGLSPLLQHPAMLIHPPIVFLGYSLWAIPWALALVALLRGEHDSQWIRAARRWALSAWTVLGVGILLGANWAYEELGWGGYWSWDPVENGSLIPWLTGTALLHAMMAWQYARVLKKTTHVLALATFALCNFATFLTRSGIFSSLHAFSQSPLGWLFLGLVAVLMAVGLAALVLQREGLRPERPMRSVLCREALVLTAIGALLLLAVATLAGTLSGALSAALGSTPILVGPAFYNGVLTPTGLTLLATTALAPLLRWNRGPTALQRRWIMACCGTAVMVGVAILAADPQRVLLPLVSGLATAALTALCGAVLLDGARREPAYGFAAIARALLQGRRQYAGFLIHMGFVCLALGVTGSSLGKQQQDFELADGQRVAWQGHTVELVRRYQRELPQRIEAAVELRVARDGKRLATLFPAQHFHRLSEEWTTEVAIHSRWTYDFYTIVHRGTVEDRVSLTLMINPMMRWLWLGGAFFVAGTLIRLWPGFGRPAARPSSVPRASNETASRQSTIPAPHRTRRIRAAKAGEA